MGDGRRGSKVLLPKVVVVTGARGDGYGVRLAGRGGGTVGGGIDMFFFTQKPNASSTTLRRRLPGSFL